MGKNAMEFYMKGHKPEDMANGLYKAIELLV